MRTETPSWLSLSSDEEVHYIQSPSYITAVPSVVTGAVIVAVSLVAWLYVGGTPVGELLPGDTDIGFVVPWYVFAVGVLVGVAHPGLKILVLRHIRYVVTTRRIVHKTGVLSTNTQSKTHDSIQEVKMSRSPFEKLLAFTGIADIADFTVSSAGTGAREMRLDNVRNPSLFQEKRVEASSTA